MIIAMSSFTKGFVIKMFSVHFLCKAGVFKFFQFEERLWTEGLTVKI